MRVSHCSYQQRPILASEMTGSALVQKTDTLYKNLLLEAQFNLKHECVEAHHPIRLCSGSLHQSLPPKKKGSRSCGGGGALHWSWRGSRGGWLKLLGTGPGVCCGNSGGPYGTTGKQAERQNSLPFPDMDTYVVPT